MTHILSWFHYNDTLLKHTLTVFSIILSLSFK